MKLVVLLFLLSFAAGCGTVHFGSVTHTHIYDDGKSMDSDDAMEGKLGRIMAYIAKVSGEDTPLKGFAWDEKKISKLEKKQKRKGGTDDKDDVFNENF